MKHTWGKEYIKHTMETQKCVMCGCERFPFRRKKIILGYGYSRSGLNLNDSPDCIDWDLENSKTID